MHGRALQQGGHQLVRIPSHRSGSLNAGQFVFSFAGEQKTTTPSGLYGWEERRVRDQTVFRTSLDQLEISLSIAYVNVQPHIVLVADIGQRNNRIKGAWKESLISSLKPDQLSKSLTQNRCATSAVHKERSFLLFDRFLNETLQFGGYHTTSVDRREHRD